MIEMFYALLIFGISLCFIGFFRKQALVLLVAGIIFMSLGSWLLVGVTYKTQSIITDINSSAILVQDVYTTWGDSFITNPMGWMFIFLGFFFIMICIYSFYHGGKMDFSIEDVGDDNE